MNRSLIRYVLVSLAVLIFGIIGAARPAVVSAQDATPEATMSATGEAPYTADQVKQAAALGKAQAHLLAAVANWKNNDFALSAAHAGHAQAEAYIVQDELKAANADTVVFDALNKFAEVVSKAGDVKDIEAAQQTVLDALKSSKENVLGDLNNNPQFNGSVIMSLIGGAEGEYSEALNNGKMAKLAEYQDAMGFTTVAALMWDDIKPTLTDADAAEVKKIDDGFKTLSAAFPDFIKAPEPPASYDDVEKLIHEIEEPLKALLDLPELKGDSVEAAIDNVKEMVEDALKEYKNGNADEAYEKAANAYLEGFEYLEADLLKLDKDIVATLEVQFKDLRDGIKAGKPAADLETLADSINENLEKAEALLESH